MSRQTILALLLVCLLAPTVAADNIRQDMRNVVSSPCSDFQGVGAAGAVPIRDTTTPGPVLPTVPVNYSTSHQTKDFDAGNYWTVGQNDTLEWCFDDGSTIDKAFMMSMRLSMSIDTTEIEDTFLLFNDGVQTGIAIDASHTAASQFHSHRVVPHRLIITPSTCVDVRLSSILTRVHTAFQYTALFRQIECHDRHHL